MNKSDTSKKDPHHGQNDDSEAETQNKPHDDRQTNSQAENQDVPDDALQDSDVTEYEQQIGELTEALQRERADATNIRRRHDEQIAGLRNVTKANVVRDLLPVIDNFDRALKHVPKDLEGNDFVKGVQGVVKQFEKTLQDIGVERIATVGEPFDPRFHEAVQMDEEDGGTEEIVSEELQSGYKLGEEVIRHAMVKVKLQ